MFNFDTNNNIELPTFILRNKAFYNLGSIKGIQAFNPTFNYNSCQEFSCEIYKFENGIENPSWDKLKDSKIIYIPEFNEQYEIGISVNDEDATKKTITGKSLCEAELSQRVLRDIEINTETDIARDDYVISVFYDESNPKASILNRILDKVPHYKIGYVAPTLKGISRTFSIDGISIYDFMTGDLADEYDCLFIFDSLTRTINCYDLLNYCPSCKKRFDSSESNNKLICPKCGNTKNIIKGYGEDTTVFISKDNLANSIDLQTNKDDVKNMFKIIGGDDNINAAVSYLTMNNGYIINITNDIKSDMSTTLTKKVDDYNKKLKELEPEYESLITEYYTSLTRQLELEHSMSPTVDIKNDSTAQKELDKIQISTIALPPETKNPSLSVVENAIKAYAKINIDTGKFNLKLIEGTYSNNIWNGKINIENLNDNNDTVTSNRLSIEVNTEYETFIQQKVQKVLGKSEIKDIEYDWTKYSLERLNSFHSAYQDVVDVLVDMQISNYDETSEEYKIYKKYYNKLIAIQSEIIVREKQIEKTKNEVNNTLSLMTEKQKIVDIKTFFGSDYIELCAYLREDTYSNDNYISDGLSDTEIINRAKELIEAAKKECAKKSEISYTLTADINNLMAMKEFKPLWNRFKLGNWIRLEADEKIYRLRLISYSFDFSDLSKINVEFSNLSKVDGITTDTQSILDQASSLSNTISYIQQQSKKNNATSLILDNWTQQGFIDTLGMVSDANNQSFIMDSHGFLGQRWNEFNNAYDPKKIKIINNGIYLTTDDFKTSKCGIGEFYYIDPATKQKVDAYGVIADTIIGKIILGEKVGIYNANNSMSFDENGLVITTNDSDDKETNAFTIQKQTNIDGVSTIKKMMYINEDGNLCMGNGTIISWNDINSPEISNITGLKSALQNIDNSVQKSLSEISDMGADNKVTPVEKIQLREKYQQEQENYTTIVSSYKDVTYIDHSKEKSSTTLKIIDSNEYNNYVNNYKILTTMCEAILSNMTTTYEMSNTENYSRNTYNTNWKNYYNSYQSLLNFLNQIVNTSASYAEKLGDELVNVLGYDGTKIKGTYIYSPVIQGGTLLIGNKDNIYSEITKDGKLIARACEIKEQSTIAGFTFVKYKKYDKSVKKDIDVIGLENNTSQDIANVGIHSSGGWAIFVGTRSVFTEDPNSFENIRGEYHLPHQFSVGHEGNVYCTNLMIGNRTPVFNSDGTLNIEATCKNDWTGGNLSVRGNGVFYKGVIIGNSTTSGSLNLIGDCHIGNIDNPGTISAIATVNIGNEKKYSNVNIIGNVTIGNDTLGNDTLTTKPIINMFGTCNISNGLNVTDGNVAFTTNVHIGTSKSNNTLHVNGDCTISGNCTMPSVVGVTAFKDDVHIGTITNTRQLHVNGYTNITQNLDVQGILSVGTNNSPAGLNIVGDVHLGNNTVNTNVFVVGNLTTSGVCTFPTISGTTTFREDVNIGSTTARRLMVNGYTNITQNLDVLGSITTDKDVNVKGNLYVEGSTKARLVKTKHFGNVAMSAYETATPYFGDIGNGVTDEFCKCYIYLDDIFKETIIENTEYYIFLQVYGDNKIYVSEKYKDYFIVESNNPNVKFCWEIKCRQKDTNNMRMDVIDIETEEES